MPAGDRADVVNLRRAKSLSKAASYRRPLLLGNHPFLHRCAEFNKPIRNVTKCTQDRAALRTRNMASGTNAP
jgi:hypothetical protein